MDTICSILEKKSELLSFLKSNDLVYLLSKTEKGLEREALRFDKTTKETALTLHPQVYEPKNKHKYVTTDYAEAQVEFVTDVFQDSKELHDFLNTLFDDFALEIGENETIWPYSLPPVLTNIDKIESAKFGYDSSSAYSETYREYLTEKYGKEKQLISGIHYNFSLCNKFIDEFQHSLDCDTSKSKIKSSIYFKLMRNYNRFKFLTTMLFGATPISHKSFGVEASGISIRNSKYGYRNKEELKLSYENLDSFVKSIKKNIQDKNIYDEREIYSSVRLKTRKKYLLNEFDDSNVVYVEIRDIDINPFEKVGISVKDLEFIDLFMLYCILEDDCSCENRDTHGTTNQDAIVLADNIDVMLTLCSGEITAREYGIKIINNMSNIFSELGIEHSVLNTYLDMLKNNDLNYLKVRKLVEDKGYTEAFESLSNEYKEEAHKNRFKLYGYEDLELSTQILIRAGLKQGISFTPLDRADNFILFEKNGKSEYVKQATKTSKDNYATILAMENKVVTKKILAKEGIVVPDGADFQDPEEAFEYAKRFKGSFVIKPKSTNFGLGVFIFIENFTEEEIKKAIEVGFGYDDTVLVEKYISGNEYRFLVVGDETVGVLNRVPANVTGDGVHTITELVEEKNKDSLRGKGYKTPLEKIKIDDNVKIFLSNKGIDEHYVPKKDEYVQLRVNSNISTGGDSIDITDEVHQRFKDIAVEASKAVDAVFCGVDIIIDDYSNPKSSYAIIELNFNPAIHIHSFPYKGKERRIADKVLKVLGY